MPLADDVDLEKLAKKAEGYVGADIEAVCREAVMLTLRNDLKAEKVKMKQFREAMPGVRRFDESWGSGTLSLPAPPFGFHW